VPGFANAYYPRGLVFGGGRKNDSGQFAIEPGLLGFVNSCYQLGSILAVPFAPWFAQRYGRRWSIMLGSVLMVAGALLQGFSQHGKLNWLYLLLSRYSIYLDKISLIVYESYVKLTN
jgi:MFS family permease